MLSSTERVKKILENECNEAKNVLRVCPIEITIEKEVDEFCCTCDPKASLENQAKEIVEGIGRALAQAQELREKIAINISKEKRKAREPNVETIYKPMKKMIAKEAHAKGHEKSASSKPKILMGKKQESKFKTVVEKKLLQVSADNSFGSNNTAKTKKTKNFVAANKSNIKNLKRNSESATDRTRGFSVKSPSRKKSSDLSPITGTSTTPSVCSTSIAELNDLMNKISVQGPKSLISGSQDPDCPCHGADAQKIVKQRVKTTVDLMEALDRFGIPGNIVKSLKIYHFYINKQSPAQKTTDKKCQSAASKFLTEFDGMNEYRATKRKTNDRAIADLTIGFSSLFRDSYHHSSKVENYLTDVTDRYTELDRRGKICQLQKFDPVKFRKKKTSVRLKSEGTIPRGWSSNGVWNLADLEIFSDMTETNCIRYTNRGQLLALFELNQRLQLLIYHRNLLVLLMDKVMPNIVKDFKPNSTEYCDAYKMIFTIAQVLNPHTTVLVRTDI